MDIVASTSYCSLPDNHVSNNKALSFSIKNQVSPDDLAQALTLTFLGQEHVHGFLFAKAARELRAMLIWIHHQLHLTSKTRRYDKALLTP